MVINRRFNRNVSHRQAFVLSSPAHAAEALSFLRDQKSKQKVAGNSIPRSRLPSDREIAHSRGRRFCLMNKRTKAGDIKKQLPERFVPAVAASILRSGPTGRKNRAGLACFSSWVPRSCGRMERPIRSRFVFVIRKPPCAGRMTRRRGLTIGCRDRGFCLRCL